VTAIAGDTLIPSLAAQTPEPCAPGTFNPYTGAGPCLLAPPGTYVTKTGATSPIDCPAGTANPNSGSSSISACVTTPAGTYAEAGPPSQPIVSLGSTIRMWARHR